MIPIDLSDCIALLTFILALIGGMYKALEKVLGALYRLLPSRWLYLCYTFGLAAIAFGIYALANHYIPNTSRLWFDLSISLAFVLVVLMGIACVVVVIWNIIDSYINRTRIYYTSIDEFFGGLS